MADDYYYQNKSNKVAVKDLEENRGDAVNIHDLDEILDGLKQMVTGTTSTVRISTHDAAMTLVTDDANVTYIWPMNYLCDQDKFVFKQIFETFNNLAHVYTDKKDRPDSVVKSEYLYLRVTFEEKGVSFIFSMTTGENGTEGFLPWEYFKGNKSHISDLTYILSVLDGSYEHMARVIRARGGQATKIAMEIV